VSRSGLKPVFGIDIDGTLGAYHNHFMDFAAEWLGRGFRCQCCDAVLHDFGDYAGGPLHKHMGISKARYREIKLAYRQSGFKRSMRAYEGARELTVGLRKAGAEVVICTTRPYLHLSNIEPDTREWLRRNGIQYDDIILGEHKYRELKRGYGDRVVAVLDDLPEMVLQAQSLGMTSVLREQPYNTPTNWFSASDLRAASAALHGLLNQRKGRVR
jgi:uncharacterized HAD superfamily protein